MEISVWTDVGHVRPNNEDAFLALPPWREPALSAKMSLFLVADGMGGHAGGEIASRIAVDEMKKWLSKNIENAFSFDALEAAIADTNIQIWEEASKNSDHQGMGTTLSVVLLKDTSALIGHVGDTRVYLLRKGELKQLTKDHTLVAEQVKIGNLTPEQALKHPARHILTRAVGVRQFVQADTSQIELQPNDIFLLCSDGIYGQIPEEDIVSIIQTNRFKKIAKILVDKANEAGGTDNSTAVLVKINNLPISFPAPFSWQRFKRLWNEWWTHL